MPHRRLGVPQEHQRQGGAGQCGLHAHTNGRKGDWDGHLTLAEFAINNATLALGDDLTPFFIDRGANPPTCGLPLSPPHNDRATGESPSSGCGRWSRRCWGCSLQLLQHPALPSARLALLPASSFAAERPK